MCQKCVIFSYLLFLWVASFVTCRPAVNTNHSQEPLPEPQRIIHGKEVYIYDYPYLVYLGVATANLVLCGGSILNQRAVLTAGHCVYDKHPDELIVVAGYNKESRNMQYRDVEKLIMHPQYSMSPQNQTTENRYIDYDYAVVKTERPFEYTLAIKSVVLGKSMESVSIGDSMFVMGWGEVKPKQIPASENIQGITAGAPLLKGVSLNLLDFNKCQQSYADIQVTVSDRFFCAASRNGDTCQGDSGGPIVVGRIQYGIVSFAAGCFRDGYPSVFANVPMVYDWIMAEAGGRMVQAGQVIYLFSMLLIFL